MRSYGRRETGILESAALLVVAWVCVLLAILRGLWDLAGPLRRAVRREPWWALNFLLCAFILALLLYAGRAHAMGGKAPAPPPVVAALAVDGDAEGEAILPGALMVNLQFPREDQMLARGPGALPATNAEHAAYIADFASAAGPALAEAGIRGFAVNWGVQVTGDPRLGIPPWEARAADDRRGDGVQERPLVGPGDACALARRWDAGAVALGLPGDKRAPEAARAAAAAFDAAGCADTILYLGAGVEATSLARAPGLDPDGVAALVHAVRLAVAERRHAVVLAYQMAGQRYDRVAWGYNRRLAERAAALEAAEKKPLAAWAFDVHPYLADPGWTRGTPVSGRDALDAELFALAPREAPAWLRAGGAAGVAMEAAVEGGLRAKDGTTSDAEPPWAVALASADLVREAWTQGLAAVALFDALSRAPREWPYAAFRRGEGGGWTLTEKARAVGFLAAGYRGWRLPGRYEADGLRLLATRDAAGAVHVLGGCFSETPCEALLTVPGRRLVSAEAMEEGAAIRPLAAEGGLFSVPARALLRATWRKP